MHSSVLLSVLLAVTASSSPLIKHGLKRDIVQDLTVVTITKWVDADGKVVSESLGPLTTSDSVAPTSSVAVDAAANGGNNNQYGYGHRKQGHRHSHDASTTDSTTTPSDVQTTSTSIIVDQVAPSSTASTTTLISIPADQGIPSSTSSIASTTSVVPSSSAPAVIASTTSVVPSSSVAAAPAAAGTDYQSLALNAHNSHRANHSAPALTWSSTLADTAAKIASSCVYQHDTQTDGGGYGQNIAAGIEPNNVNSIITDLFYNGEFDYYKNQWGEDNPDMSNFKKWGHLTQILWHDTSEVGCATKKCGTLANTGPNIQPYFTVCNYKAPGNMAGEYHNVGKPLGGAYTKVLDYSR